MVRWLLLLVLSCLLIGTSAKAQQRPHDYAPFAAIDGYQILGGSLSTDVRFDFYEFPSDASGKKTRVEGRKIHLFYSLKDGAQVSRLEVMRTVAEQAKSVNGEILFQDDSELVTRFQRNGTTVWVDIHQVGGTPEVASQFWYEIVEEKPLHLPGSTTGSLSGGTAVPASPVATDSTGRPRIVAGSTEGLLDATGKPIQAPIAPTLKATGHVQVYINFVTDSAQLQPSSTPVLNELLATLKASPDLKVDLIGHTDAVGSDAHNQDLSKRRAASVYLWLVQHGIARDHLESEGRGFLEPIATNETAEGRALNRRVEVKTTG